MDKNLKQTRNDNQRKSKMLSSTADPKPQKRLTAVNSNRVWYFRLLQDLSGNCYPEGLPSYWRCLSCFSAIAYKKIGNLVSTFTRETGRSFLIATQIVDHFTSLVAASCKDNLLVPLKSAPWTSATRQEIRYFLK